MAASVFAAVGEGAAAVDDERAVGDGDERLSGLGHQRIAGDMEDVTEMDLCHELCSLVACGESVDVTNEFATPELVLRRSDVAQASSAKATIPQTT